MAARDRWKISIRCPKCGLVGDVLVSEADGAAFVRDQSISIDKLPDGFKRADQGDDSAMDFVCINDGITAEKTR